MFLDQPLHAVALGSGQEGILKLLRIDARRVLAEQWHHEIGSDHMLHDLLVFQQPHSLFVRLNGYVDAATVSQAAVNATSPPAN